MIFVSLLLLFLAELSPFLSSENFRGSAICWPLSAADPAD